MEDVYVARVMSTDLVFVSPDTLVEDAANRMLDEGIGSLLVTDETGSLAGILTSTDFVDIVAASKPKAETTVSRYMSTDLVTTSAQTPVRDVADLMFEHDIHHVPIVDEAEGAIGIVTTSDLTKYLSAN